MSENIIDKRTCKNCQAEFTITDFDQKFYDRFDVPRPTHCPLCRKQRHYAQVNQINLYKVKCAATGKEIVSNYPPQLNLPVYDQKSWFDDKFDAREYGRDFDFSRPFFEQFSELKKVVPRRALFNDFGYDENSEYTNYAGKNKNCYLIFDSDENWDAAYGYGVNNSRNALDAYRVQNLELCYEVVDSKDCFNCAYIYNSQNCSDSWFLNNCMGCRHCIYCSNLQQKEYHVFNEPVSKEKFEEIADSFKSYQYLTDKIGKFHEFRLQFPHKYMRGFQNENCTGNHLVNCKNALECYDSMNLWDAKYATQVFISGKDFMEVDECGESELLYETNNSGYNAFNLRFCVQCMVNVSELTYCFNCVIGCSNLFGCVGLRKKKFCILNKQYTEEEYKELVPRIIEHMKTPQGGAGVEWGEHYPIASSDFLYNISLAQEWMPLTKEQAVAKGYQWLDEDPKEYRKSTFQIPDSIDEVNEDIVNQILSCEQCGRNYKIIESEWKFYKRKGIPLPHKCFYCRHRDRIALRTERKLYDRTCDKCSAPFQTAYSPDRPEIVYCEKCYLESIK